MLCKLSRISIKNEEIKDKESSLKFYKINLISRISCHSFCLLFDYLLR